MTDANDDNHRFTGFVSTSYFISTSFAPIRRFQRGGRKIIFAQSLGDDCNLLLLPAACPAGITGDASSISNYNTTRP